MDLSPGSISSQLSRHHDDEFVLEPSDMASGALPKRSKIMVRKTFVISCQVIVKKYGQLSDARLRQLHHDFCHFFGCC